MALSTKTKEVLLHNLFYSPNTQFTTAKSLYEQVKNKGITRKEVKEFVDNQECNQLFKKQKRIKNYFPICAKHKFEILQIDLVDMSNIARANENYKYLIVCVDVFSRLAFVVPMKNKETLTIIEAIEEVFDITEPHIINCDNGSEFISHDFKKFVKERGITINYVSVHDHHKLGLVDRMVRNLRERINKYLVMHNTTKYIDVLPNIVYNYNHSFHSQIKKAPIEVDEEDEKVIELTRRKIEKAKQEETKFHVGDNVRFILNKALFDKGTLPKWSKEVHKIISNTEHTYKLDNSKTYKYYELQKVNQVQRLDRPIMTPTREEMRKERTSERRFRKEGLDKNMILD